MKTVHLKDFSKENQEKLREFIEIFSKKFKNEPSKMNKDAFFDEYTKFSDIYKKKISLFEVFGRALYYGQHSLLDEMFFEEGEEGKEKTPRDIDLILQMSLAYRDGYEVDKLIGDVPDARKLFFARFALVNKHPEIYDYANLDTEKFVEVSKLLCQGNSKENIDHILANEGHNSLDNKLDILTDDEYGISSDEDIDIDLSDLGII